MKKLFTTCCAATLALATTAFGQAFVIAPPGHEITKYYDFKQWTIYADATRKSCLMSKTDAEGNIFQAGITADNNYGYVGMFRKGGFGGANSSHIAISVNGTTYVGDAKALNNIEGGYAGGYVLSNQPRFASDIEAAKTLTAFPDSPIAYVVNLEGSGRALRTARKCNSVKGWSN